VRLLILAVGNARGTSEGALTDDFITRAKNMGRRMGVPDVAVEEIAVSKARETPKRMQDEAERLAARVPEGAQVILLDAKGRGMTSEDFAEMIGALRDAGTKNLVFVIGGPDGLGTLQKIRPGRSLAFGPQTWPHLMARAMLSEQLYRALTILAGHPYHRA
jgi:23S rRNA (pseudouridine1915-N3)-methyltransferase